MTQKNEDRLIGIAGMIICIFIWMFANGIHEAGLERDYDDSRSEYLDALSY